MIAFSAQVVRQASRQWQALQGVKMASEKKEDDPIIKGSKLLVTVEEALTDVLLVCFDDGAKQFRGALLDSGKGNLPFGVNMPESPWTQDDSRPSAVDISSPCSIQETTVKPELSCLGTRHTYSLDPEISTSKLLPSPKKDIASMLRHRNSRPHMRLRPKQVFCVRCKKRMMEDKDFLPHDRIDFKTCKQKEKTVEAKQMIPGNNISFKNCKQNDKLVVTPQKAHHSPENQLQAKCSPILKISFSSPTGRETVMKILPKPDSEDTTNGPRAKTNSEHHSGLNQQHYKKVKRALKKARHDTKLASKQTPLSHDVKLKHKRERKVHTAGKHNTNKTISKVHRSKVNWQPRVVLSKNLNQNSSVGSSSILKSMLDPDVCTQSVSGYRNSYTVPENKQCKRKRRLSHISASNHFSDTDNELSATPPHTKNKSPSQNPKLSEPDDTSSSSSPPGQEAVSPLRCDLKTCFVKRVQLEDGRSFKPGNVVWGKIQGFPWWPCKIQSLTKGTSDLVTTPTPYTAQVNWFGSSTFSCVLCSELQPFLENFQRRHNKKKKGSYRQAVQQALAEAKRRSAAEHNDVETTTIEIMED